MIGGASGPHFFARIPFFWPGIEHGLAAEEPSANIYRWPKAASLRGRRHCEQNIYKTHKAASLAGRKVGSKQMPGITKSAIKSVHFCALAFKI